jgi:hypothetical protein
MHQFEKQTRAGYLAGVLLVMLPFDALSQSSQSKQIPTAKPSTAKESPGPVVEQWFQDPRWWAIAATGGLSILSLSLQWRYRITDRRDNEASEHFDGDIKDPIKESYKELRTLANLAAVTCETVDQTQRNEAIKKLRYESACTTLNLFSMVLREADRRLSLKGEFSDINAELEDVLYVSLGAMTKCDDSVERRVLLKKISDAVLMAIVESDKKLGDQRKLYIRRWK